MEIIFLSIGNYSCKIILNNLVIFNFYLKLLIKNIFNIKKKNDKINRIRKNRKKLKTSKQKINSKYLNFFF